MEWKSFFAFRLNRRTAAKIADRIGRLENVLNECIERLLDERSSVQIDAICLLIKAYTNQKGREGLLHVIPFQF